LHLYLFNINPPQQPAGLNAAMHNCRKQTCKISYCLCHIHTHTHTNTHTPIYFAVGSLRQLLHLFLLHFVAL